MRLIAARLSSERTTPEGLLGVFTSTRRVFSVIAAAKAARSGCRLSSAPTGTTVPPAPSIKTRYSEKKGARTTASSPGFSSAWMLTARAPAAPVATWMQPASRPRS